MDIELIHELDKDNVVLDALSWKEELGKSFYWPEMKEDVEDYICTCIKCQSTKSIHKKEYKSYKPLLSPNGMFESISMDFMMCLPLWEKKDVILVVIDKFLKLAKLGTTKTTATITEITTLFFDM